MIDHELMFWEEADGLTPSPGIDVAKVLVAGLPEIFLLTSHDALLNGAYFNIIMEHFIGAWDPIQINDIYLSGYRPGAMVVFSVPSYVRNSVIRLRIGDLLGLSAGTVTAGMNLDQQTNI